LNIAFVIDALNNHSVKILKRIAKEHSVCIFLPETDDECFYAYYQIRKFNDETSESVFQRYDLVVFYANDNWDIILPLIRIVKGVSIVNAETASLSEIRQLSAKTYYCDDDILALISQLPQHIHWYDREVRLVSERLEKFGLLSEKVKQAYESLYSMPLEKNWLQEWSTR
jgi:hypothetical protein